MLTRIAPTGRARLRLPAPATIVTLLAGQAAVAIENARLYESSRRWADQLKSLIEVGNALATETVQYVPIYLGTAVAYLLLTLPSGQAVGWLERKVAIRR